MKVQPRKKYIIKEKLVIFIPIIMAPNVKNWAAQPAVRRIGKIKFPDIEPILPVISVKDKAEALEQKTFNWILASYLIN